MTTATCEEAAIELARYMLDPVLGRDVILSLPAQARSALEALLEARGRLPWAIFIRRFGGIRPIGAGHRDREQVHLESISPVEVLVYHSLVENAFFDTPTGLQEFAYIPTDLLPIIQQVAGAFPQKQKKEIWDPIPGRPATSREIHHVLIATGFLLDDAVTLLAALRMGITPQPLEIPINVVGDFLRSAELLTGNKLSPSKVKDFLEMPPSSALDLLADAWQAADSFNELRQLPGLLFEGEWNNSPHTTRQILLGFLDSIPRDRWWSLPAFVNHIYKVFPDFQRPSGDYDSWFIKRNADGVFLRGFETWDEVDGALIRYIITGPMHWLGKVDLASTGEGGVVTAFRRRMHPPERKETARLSVSSNGTIIIPRQVPRQIRYQVSRFCDWHPGRQQNYHFQVTGSSLQRAVKQGLKISQLLGLLSRNSQSDLPPSFIKALKRWDTKSTEARLETQTILHVSQPEVLEELRNSKAGRFLGEVLGPTAVVIQPGAQAKVIAALTALGLLTDYDSRMP